MKLAFGEDQPRRKDAASGLRICTYFVRLLRSYDFFRGLNENSCFIAASAQAPGYAPRNDAASDFAGCFRWLTRLTAKAPIVDFTVSKNAKAE